MYPGINTLSTSTCTLHTILTVFLGDSRYLSKAFSGSNTDKGPSLEMASIPGSHHYIHKHERLEPQLSPKDYLHIVCTHIPSNHVKIKKQSTKQLLA